jgi:hypothetical protein
MTDYIGAQRIQTVPAGELGSTVPGDGQSVNFGVGIYENRQTIVNDYCITTGSGGFSVGPINIAAVVRVPDGSSWTIV